MIKWIGAEMLREVKTEYPEMPEASTQTNEI